MIEFMSSLTHSLSMFAFLAAVACGGTVVTNSAASRPEDQFIRRIDPDDAALVLAHDGAVIIDVRPARAFLAEHISGARLLPYIEVMSRLDELPRDRLIITYCS